MSATINTNLNSLTAQRNSSKSQNDLTTAINRLSSGLRINSAKDDAAGLAISERFTSQIRGLNQAARNSNDGISLAQTAEGALGSIGSNLQRMRELAVQSANATNSSSDRAALQQEVSQLASEIDRVATQTQFNGTNLIDGSFTAQQFQVGANAGQTITVAGIASARTSDLGKYYSASATGATLTAATGVTGAGQFTINGTDIYGGTAIGGDAKSLAAAINSKSIAGVTATAQPTSVAGTYTAAAAVFQTGTLTINGVNMSVAVTGVQATDQGNTIGAINANSAATGVTASLNAGGTVSLTAADGRNITTAWNAGTGGDAVVADLGLGGVAATTYSSYNIDYVGSGALVTGGTAAASITGFTSGTTTNVSATGTAISNIDISTVSGANAALAAVDAALTTVNSNRAALGAIQNRFSSTIENLQTSSENLSASRSRIQDADFAAETANLSRAQVLQQAGTAMIAQANQLPSQVLSLLR